jgi:hypothetical protein
MINNMKYEYEVATPEVGKERQTLNELGKMGYSVVGVVYNQYSGRTTFYLQKEIK